MELVWGPELSYTESNSQVYKFLGSEKYQSVLNSIYAGLGVPPTLTGIAGQSGGFTNNFISLKTLVERLQYGRDQLTKFWQTELEQIRKSMGFRKSAHVVYDQMSLSDEASEKNLLIQLADRDIISHETVLERFKEIPAVEKVRLQREDKDRDSEKIPPKASPFHNANHDKEMEKIDKQGDVNKKNQDSKEPKSPKNDNGRPPFKQDEGPRKKRVETPKSKPGVAEMFIWTSDTLDKVSEISNAYLGVKGKSNMRQLTKAESKELEDLKLSVLTNLEPMQDVNIAEIHKVLSSNKPTPLEFRKVLASKNVSVEKMTIETYKKHIISLYVDFYLG